MAVDAAYLAVDDDPLIPVHGDDLRVAVRLTRVVDEAREVAHLGRVDHLQHKHIEGERERKRERETMNNNQSSPVRRRLH